MRAGQWRAARDGYAAFPGLEESPEALAGLGLALWWLDEPIAGLAARTRAYRLYRARGDTLRAGAIAVWLSREYRSLLRNGALAEGWLARAQGLVPAARESALSAWIDLAAAESQAPTKRSADLAEGAVREARVWGDIDLEIVALSRLGAIRVVCGDVEDGLRLVNEALVAATAGEGRDPQSVAEALCTLMDVAGWLGDPTRLTPWATFLVDFGQAFAFGPLLPVGPAPTLDVLSAFCEACCGGVYLVTGRVDAAEQRLTSAAEHLRRSGLHPRCIDPRTELAGLRVLQGRLEEAGALLAECDESFDTVATAAALDLARGVPGQAVARLCAVLREADEPIRSLPAWAVLVEAALAAGDPARARAASARVTDVAARTGTDFHAAHALLASGRVAAAAGDPVAEDLLPAAAHRFAEVSAPLLASRARLELAAVLAPGDRPRAVTEARSALLAFDRMGASADADRAAGFLRSLGVRGRTGPRDLGLLSRREVEVLRLVAEGLSNAEIADRLVISVKTAGHHVSSILTKLGLRSRTEAAAFALLRLPPTTPTAQPQHASK